MGEIFERVRPEFPLEWTGERLTTATAGQVEVEHLHRYFLARDLCRGLDVLDVASGEGYGSALLAGVACSVIGVEVSAEAVSHARRAYHAINLRFQQGDARQLPVPDASLDAVVSFETLEHFYEHDRFIAEARRVLRPGGRLILSSPDRDVYSPPGAPANQFHVHELSRAEFASLLGASFAHVRLLSQRPMLGSALVVEDATGTCRTVTFERRGERHYERSEALPRAPYLLAVASDAAVDNVPNSLLVETDAIQPALTHLAGGEGPVTATLRRRVESVEAEYDVALKERERLLTQASTYESAAREAEATIGGLSRRAEAAEAERERLLAQASTYESDAIKMTRALDELWGREEASRVAAELHEARALSAEADASALRERCELLQRTLRRQVSSISAAQVARHERATREVKVLQAEAAEWQRRYEGLHVRTKEFEAVEAERDRLLARAGVLQAEAAEWQRRYEGLRVRLITILQRFGIARASRLVPKPVRSFVRERMLGGPRR